MVKLRRCEQIKKVAMKCSSRGLMKSQDLIRESSTLGKCLFIGNRTISTASKDWERVSKRDNMGREIR